MRGRTLIIAAHPDDDILGCGGIMSKFKEKVDFKVLFIGEGSTCRYKDPNCIEAKNEVKKRNKMGVKALNFLGVKNYIFSDLPCGRLDQIPQIEINKIIENEIKNFNPSCVLTHSRVDCNKDHIKVLDATLIATRPGNSVKEVLSYEVLSSSEWGFENSFTPNVFFHLENENLNDKCESFKFYESEIKEFPYPRSENAIRSLASVRGFQSGTKYAEAYTLIRQNR